MSTEQGGGASRSTDPAQGTSSATDVSLREFVSIKVEALDRHLTAELKALRNETMAANRNAERAIEVAAHEAAERLAAHNGLIEQMQKMQGTFATRQSLDDYKERQDNTLVEIRRVTRDSLDAYKEAADKRIGRVERFQSMLVGGFLFVSFVGVANLVKVWT